MKRNCPAILAVSGIIIVCFLLQGGCAKTTPLPDNRAVIVDQLAVFEPNAPLVAQITGILSAGGLSVDYFQGEQITVDFYRKLAQQGYKLVLLRSHAGLLGSQDKAIPRTCIFTGEPYSERKYISEQLTDQLAKARIDADKPWVFAVGARFVERSMPNRYNGTLFLMMGCSSLYLEDLSESLVKKGAASCIGWDASIGSEYMDKATLSLVEKIYRDKLTVDRAVAEIRQALGPDPDFGGELKYYPPASGSLTFPVPSR
jgi:hypothetical protein